MRRKRVLLTESHLRMCVLPHDLHEVALCHHVDCDLIQFGSRLLSRKFGR